MHKFQNWQDIVKNLPGRVSGRSCVMTRLETLRFITTDTFQLHDTAQTDRRFAQRTARS